MLADYKTAPIDKKEKVLFAFVEKVNADSPSIRKKDIQALRAVGWSDEAIYDAVMVCGLFNFYTRWVDATGVHEMSSEGHRASGKRIAARGYLMTKGRRRQASGS